MQLLSQWVTSDYEQQNHRNKSNLKINMKNHDQPSSLGPSRTFAKREARGDSVTISQRN